LTAHGEAESVDDIDALRVENRNEVGSEDGGGIGAGLDRQRALAMASEIDEDCPSLSLFERAEPASGLPRVAGIGSETVNQEDGRWAGNRLEVDSLTVVRAYKHCFNRL
jgi:hypothetical protein